MNRLLATFVLFGLGAPALALAQSSSAPALTDAHARSAMMQYGCTAISGLSTRPDGQLQGQCTKGGKMVNVSMDKTGKVEEVASLNHVTDGQARYALTQFGCGNISNLGTGPGGTWHGQCYKGGVPTNVMVDAKGVASAGAATHVTESAARSMLTGFGCGNISTLTMGGDGSWYGQCAKGGKTQNVSVDSTGKMAAN
ncbi:MAG TPA: hypothetical protein VGC15_01890 [Acetobacteraceae bacterium]